MEHYLFDADFGGKLQSGDLDLSLATIRTTNNIIISTIAMIHRAFDDEIAFA